jgi:hypothetical protein
VHDGRIQVKSSWDRFLQVGGKLNNNIFIEVDVVIKHYTIILSKDNPLKLYGPS